MKGNTVKTICICVLLFMQAIISNALAEGSTRDLSGYVFLHQTRSQVDSLQFAARAGMCRGVAGGARNQAPMRANARRVPQTGPYWVKSPPLRRYSPEVNFNA